MRALGLAGEKVMVGGARRMLYLAHPNADPLVDGLTLAAAREALTRALRGLPALARRAERPRPISPIALANRAGNTWHLALDEIMDTGVDLRANLPGTAPGGRTLRAAMMRPAFGNGVPRLSATVKPLDIDLLTVVDDASYLDAIDAQPNLPTLVKQGLRTLWA